MIETGNRFSEVDKRVLQAQSDRRRELDAAMRLGVELESLLRMPAWEQVVTLLNGRLASVTNELKVAMPDAPFVIAKLQGQIQELEVLLAFVPETIQRGKEAAEEMEAAHGR